MPKPKHQDKKKRSKKEESDSEEEQSEEQESENNSEEQSEEENESEGSDDDKSGSEEASDKGSDESEEEDSAKSSSKSDSDKGSGSESGNDKEENSESEEESEDDKKKKKKKGKGKEKVKSKGKDKSKKGDKKGKGKEDKKLEKNESIKSLSKKATFDLRQSSLVKPPTISSVSQELDELSAHLSQIFPSLRNNSDIKSPKSQPNGTKKFYEDSLYQNLQQSSYGQAISQTTHAVDQLSNALKALRKPNSESTHDLTSKQENQVSPSKEDKGIQYESQTQKKLQASPEAVRAVKEYRKRKEQEKKRSNYVDQSVGSDHDFIESDFQSPNQHEKRKTSKGLTSSEVYKDRTKPGKEERKQEEYNSKDNERKEYLGNSGSQWSKSNKIAENYYGGVVKKAAREFSPAKKTLKDLYNHTPKPMYVESGKPLDKYTANGTRISRGRHLIDKYEQKFRQSGTLNRSGSESNQKDISEAMEVLMRRSKR